MNSYRRPDPNSDASCADVRQREVETFGFGAAAPRRPVVRRDRYALCGLVFLLLGNPACSDDGTETPAEPDSTETKTEENPADTKDASVMTPTEVEADDYCKHLCDRGKACDESYDRQTCVRECESESGVIGNLNPALLEGLYECVDKTSCTTIEAERFVAACLADSAGDVDPNAAGKALCKELETAADECSFTDFDERACWQVSTAYSDEVLESATICARKKCALIVDCLDATLKVPSELDGTPIGFDDGEISSGTGARAATESFLPESSVIVVSPGTDPATKPLDTTPDETDAVRTESSQSESTQAESTQGTDAPVTTPTLPTLPTSTDTAPPGIDITDPEVQAEYCVDGDVCTDCRFKACCLEALTCFTNNDCVDWIDCFTSCPAEDDDCIDSCRQTHAAGDIAAVDYVNCFNQVDDEVCASQCSTDSTDTSGLSTGDFTSTPATTNDPGSTTSETENSTVGPDPESNDTTSSDATSTVPPPDPTGADAGTDACGECLATLCDAEVGSCLADYGCYYLYVDYVDCWDGATSEEFLECFTPLYSETEPYSVSLFDDMTYCVGYAECPDCAE